MSLALFLATAFAGFAYVVSPGPAFLAVFTLAAAEGRQAAARFLMGHITGDVLWCGLALAALVGVNQLGPLLFDLLGLACGGYLTYLGVRALFTRTRTKPQPIGARRPTVTGVLFGLTNPKAYPVAAAMFASIALPYAGRLSWHEAPSLLLAAFAGFLPGYGLILFAAGLPQMRRFFGRHEVAITRVVGAMFLAFGGRILWDSGRSLALPR